MEAQTLHDILTRLAANYQWTWSTATADILESLPGAGDRIHPVRVVASLDADELATLSSDEHLVARVTAALHDLDALGTVDAPRVAYFSPEFGISHHALQYAGGLGVLAGDFLKASSDAALPLVGVGLFYHLGAFHQEIRDGAQTEYASRIEPEDIAANDTGIVVDVPFPGRDVRAKVLRIDVGRVPLLLLDSDIDGNSDQDRAITNTLYLGSAWERTAQEMILGIGGARAIRALGWDVDTLHLNEGHAGFVALDLIDRLLDGTNLETAIARARERVVFTTHTPVPAGITRLRRDILMPYLEIWAGRWGAEPESLWDLGSDPDNGDEFNMAMFCLRTSRMSNGVSMLHGEVSRDLFSSIPEGSSITHVTNGVHARTWTAPAIQELFDETLDTGWDRGDVNAWEAADLIGDERLQSARGDANENLSRLMKECGVALDPDALIVGFARRFAPYKRSTLILEERSQLSELLAEDGQPIHFLFAGKAHPANESGLAALSEIVAFARSPEAKGRFSFIPDYDMRIGAGLTQGCDIWLNNPIRLQEASGTSGEKVALNGGLNISVLDGWWAEMFDGENGFAISSSHAEDPVQRDAEDAADLMEKLVLARNEFFDSRARFNTRIRHAWKSLGPKVTAARMVDDYRRQIYRM